MAGGERVCVTSLEYKNPKWKPFGNKIYTYESHLDRFEIPKNLEIINNKEYEFDEMTEFIIPNYVTSLEESCFSNNEQLTKIEIPSSVTTVSADITSPASPFKDNTNLTEIVVRNSTKPSGFDANWNCKTFGAGNTPSGRQCTEAFNTIYRK